MSGNIFYGWFDDPSQTTPTYDPPHDAPCPFCGVPIHAGDVMTHCLMYSSGYGERSYFYRTHKSCAEKDPTHTARDGSILDMIKWNGE